MSTFTMSDFIRKIISLLDLENSEKTSMENELLLVVFAKAIEDIKQKSLLSSEEIAELERISQGEPSEAIIRSLHFFDKNADLAKSFSDSVQAVIRSWYETIRPHVSAEKEEALKKTLAEFAK